MIDLASASPKRLRHAGEWPIPTPRRAALGTELRTLQDRMPSCDGGAAPVLSGDGTERAMLIGQAPGWREIETGLPFAWDAGKRLCGWLAVAGIGVDDFRRHWYVTSIGKCYPGRAPGSSVDRPPSREEIARWTPFLRDELRLVRPELVLLVGGELAGEQAPGASVICLPHPSGASTWLNDPAHVELWRQGIALLRDRWDAIRP